MITLSPSDADIFLHTWRYQITTVADLSQIFYGGDQMLTRTKLRKLSSRTPYLQSRPLIRNQVYFQLTARATREIGAPEELSKPLGPQALPRAFGVLRFCCGGIREMRRITRGEFRDLMDDLKLEGIPFNDYYIDDSEECTVLRRIFVDLGGDAERLMRKILHTAKTLSQNSEALRLITSNALGFLVITCSERKRDALQNAARSICPSIPCKYFVQGDLLNLLPNFYE